MLLVLFFVSAVFWGIGFLINQENASYLLSGYNTLSEEERAKFNLTAYLAFFRRFHHFLGASLLLGGGVLYFISPIAFGLFLTCYPLLAYFVFAWKGTKVSEFPMKRSGKITLAIVFLAVVGVLFMLARSLSDNPLLVEKDRLVFEGSYGESVMIDQIEAIGLVDRLPPIAIKSNGFALGYIKKGKFKTKEGERIKLLVNTDHDPYILFETTSGEKLYYSSRSVQSEDVMKRLASDFPHMTRQDVSKRKDEEIRD